MAQQISQPNSNDYIPKRDSQLIDWGANFSALITAAPTDYGLNATDATTIQDAFDDFDNAYTIAVNPPTRTSPAITDKNNARNTFIQIARIFAQYIKANPSITNQQLLDLGLHVDDPTPTPIPAPVTHPMLNIVGLSAGRVVMRATDSDQAGQRAKPFGAIGLEMWVAIGDQPVSNPNEASFLQLHTRQPIDQELDPALAGQVGTFFARWVTERGLRGPWSSPTSTHLV